MNHRATALGLILGLALGLLASATDIGMLDRLAAGVAPLGTLFINAIRMVVIPLSRLARLDFSCGCVGAEASTAKRSLFESGRTSEIHRLCFSRNFCALFHSNPHHHSVPLKCPDRLSPAVAQPLSCSNSGSNLWQKSQAENPVRTAQKGSPGRSERRWLGKGEICRYPFGPSFVFCCS